MAGVALSAWAARYIGALPASLFVRRERERGGGGGSGGGSPTVTLQPPCRRGRGNDGEREREIRRGGGAPAEGLCCVRAGGVRVCAQLGRACNLRARERESRLYSSRGESARDSDGRDVVGGGCTPRSATAPAIISRPCSIHGGSIHQVRQRII